MSRLYSALNELKSNIFGGQSYVRNDSPGSKSKILRKSNIEMLERSPTSKLDNDPLAFSSISYPHDIVNDGTNGHYMLFYINVQNKTKFPYRGFDDEGNVIDVGGKSHSTTFEDITGPAGQTIQAGSEVISSGNVSRPTYGDNLAHLNGQRENSDMIQMSKFKRNKEGFASNSRGNQQTSRVTDSIAIYLPPSIIDNYANTYNATETAFLGFLIASGGKFIEQFNQTDFAGASNTAFNAFGGVFERILKESGTALLETFTGSEGGYELLNKLAGRAANPYLEVLYGGPQLRTFNYTFKFAPKNTTERDNVQKIIQMFKFHSAPEMKNDFNMFFTLPSEFDIHYMYQAEDGVANENAYFPKIATCVLQSVNTNYTPNGVKTHADGSPVTITMDLSFLETEVITKEHIEEGF